MHPPLLVLLLALAGGPAVAPQEPADGVQDVFGATVEKRRAKPDWIQSHFEAPTRADKLARDARISFSTSSADRARLVLRSGENDALGLLSAVLALGCAGGPGDVFELRAIGKIDDLNVRRASILAMGELGTPGFKTLRTMVDELGPGLGVHAAIALVRTGDEGRRFVIESARGSRSNFQEGAYVCLPWAEGGEPPRPSPAFDMLLDLRWEAARRYGFVDGQRWRSVLVEEVLKRRDFLDRTVMSASVDPNSASVRDHFFEILLNDDNPARLRAVVATMPTDLHKLIADGIWAPASNEEWRILLEEIADRRIERKAVDLLKLAGEIPELQSLAGVLLLRAGELLDHEWLLRELTSGSPASQVRVLEAFGEGREAARIEDIRLFMTRTRAPAVTGAALVALFRLGADGSEEELRELIDEGQGKVRDAALRAMGRATKDSRLYSFIITGLVLADLPDDVRLELELGLGELGRLRTRDSLRGWLARDIPSETRLRLVRVLSEGANEQDLALMRGMFPAEDDIELSVEVALVMIRYRDPVALKILRAVLWNSEFNVSVLAGRLLFLTGGLHVLIDELSSVPAHATEADIRRVGFAIGEWGGLAAVETLARRRGAEDAALQGAYLGALSTRTH